MTHASASGYFSEAASDSAVDGAPKTLGGTFCLADGVEKLLRMRRLVLGIIGCFAFGCLVYCLFATRQYEARARVALHAGPVSSLRMDEEGETHSTSLAGALIQLETLADVFRSDELAWRVILDQKLYQSPAFNGRFSSRFPHFRPDSPTSDEQAYLLERFKDRLRVLTLPRTALLEIRFRCEDPVLSATVVSDLLRVHEEQIAHLKLRATTQAVDALKTQLSLLSLEAQRETEKVQVFQKQQGILLEADASGTGETKTVQHIPAVAAVDELGRELVVATSDRIMREAKYRAAAEGAPELVMAAEGASLSEAGGTSGAVFRQIRLRRSELEQERAQLDLEHGPNFPRVLEIGQELRDFDRQVQTEDQRLRQHYKNAWQTAVEREDMLRNDLERQMARGIQANEAAIRYEELRRQADSSQQLLLKVQRKIEEAGLTAAIPSPDFWVVDAARPPAKPSWPNIPLLMAITLFIAAWISLAAVFLLDIVWPPFVRLTALLISVCVLGSWTIQAQAPTPSTSGLPSGVARIPQSGDSKAVPNSKDAPAVWNGSDSGHPGPQSAGPRVSEYVPVPIGPGDLLGVSEVHTAAMQTTVRVAPSGTVTLPMVGDVELGGMLEGEAARAIEKALESKGILRHPQVSVFVISAVGRDVSILGEVARPGIYPYGTHHNLLDLIADASGTSPTAGSLVYIFSRENPANPHVVVLDRTGSAADSGHNPELKPGDTVQVSRTGLIYVVGDVIRPGGFTVEPGQQMTVLQAISLAWGPSQNASLKNGLLIRVQAGGRTVSTLNLKRMLRGQDPDVPVMERDILFVPNSTAKNLWNRTMESVVQSAAGVSIYAGMVYSQRF